MHSELKESLLPNMEAKVELKSRYSMISTGTERLVASGLIHPDFRSHMAVPYMEGDFSLPIKYGYSVIAEKTNGSLVHTMHPHQQILQVQEEELFALPANLPAARAALISNMETVINAIWDSRPEQGQAIAICGFGNIGSLLANTLRVHHGIEVKIIERDPWRAAKAQELGWRMAESQDEFEIIYHCTANAKGLNHCLGILEEEGRLIELSWYGSEAVAVELGKNFHYKRLQMISSQVSLIPKSMRGEYDYAKRKSLAAKWLLDKSYDQLISHIIPFQESPQFFANLRKGTQENGLIYLIKF